MVIFLVKSTNRRNHCCYILVPNKIYQHKLADVIFYENGSLESLR